MRAIHSRVLPAAAVLVLAAGCTGEPAEPAETTTTTTEPTAVSTEPVKSDPPTEWTVPEDEDQGLPGDEGPAPAKDGDAEDAEDAAVTTMELLLDKNKPEKKWWPDLAEHLSPAAQDIWQYTAQRRIPTAELDGDPTVDTVSATDAEVTVPTTAGDYHLVLVREGSEDPWLVSAIKTPAEGTEQ
jgi:hypothetical protein